MADQSKEGAQPAFDPDSVGYNVVREAPRNADRHRPGHYYTSQTVYEAEKKHVFYRDWLNIGRVEEIAEPGDYLTFRVADEPVLVVRQRDSDG